MKKRVGKRGDTLIEVMLAVGIFSMVAIAVVAVMSGGTSSAQTALETTLAREEIDAQAEAIRFIHGAYIAESEPDGPYHQIWKAIKDKASDSISDIYPPADCSALYNTSGEEAQKGFVINLRKIQDSVDVLKTETNAVEIAKARSNVVVSYSDNPDKFSTASTYPRLIYGNGIISEDNQVLDADTLMSGLYRAEGIYVLVKKDSNAAIADRAGVVASYDFYIRTCWYGTGDQSPSTIYTIMRLYNPDF